MTTTTRSVTVLEKTGLDGFPNQGHPSTVFAIIVLVHNDPAVKYQVIVGTDEDNGDIVYEGVLLVKAVAAWQKVPMSPAAEREVQA
jgi:hypothetical protein